MPSYGLLNDLANSGMSGQSSLPSRSNPQAVSFGKGASVGGNQQVGTSMSGRTSPAMQAGIQESYAGQLQGGIDSWTTSQPTAAFSDPGFNLQNPGYTEQAFNYLQNRLMEDPSQQYLQNMGNQLLNPSAGENYMNQNLGTLDGPGMGEQYWNAVQGQFMDPFAGEQFARQATQNFQAQGPASAFYNQAMGQYGDFTGYNTQNAQGQYNQSAASLAGGTQGENGLAGLAGQYGAIGQYNGANNALGQYQQNAGSGPMAAQSFFDQVGGQYGQLGQYSGPNLSAGQYAQTQQAFGDLPIANFDPYYDRAIQLGTQTYNRDAAGRGVYGSSEALSGVGNVVADLNAERANRSFDAEMQRAVEQRNRQQLLGQQAQMGDQSSLAAFNSNLQGLNTFGNLANNAGNQTLAQQTMLGNQARQADLSGLDAFNANLSGVNTFANVNNMLGNQELSRNELLGNMANNADSQATAAQNARTSALSAFGNIAGQADTAETNRYTASTNAMNNADRTALDRLNTGADIAFRGDDSRRADYDTSMNQARQAANLGMDRQRLGADVMNTASGNDLARLNATMGAAGQAEGDRQGRVNSALDNAASYSRDIANQLGKAFEQFDQSGQADWENMTQAEMTQYIQALNISEKDKDQMIALGTAYIKSKNEGDG